MPIMKRYIVPLAFIVIGGAALVYWVCAQTELNEEMNQPWTHFTGVQMCPLSTNPNCDEDAPYEKYRVAFAERERPLIVVLATAAILIPSGVAIGIYRVVKQHRTSRKSS